MDEKFIQIALRLAHKNLGATAPNPCVGCVIVKDDEIIATSSTQKGGRPHAENIAINKADKNKLIGSTLYCTLEPCSHFGETPPCADLIIKSQIKKVVIALQDPDNRVNGNGIKMLQNAGIEVICNNFNTKIQEVNKGFLKSRIKFLPYLTLKLATSLDGKIATKDFQSKWISNEKSRLFAHYLRSINDAIIIGANSVKKDDPMLDCRLSGLEEYSPKRIIISHKCDFDLNLKIFQSAKQIPTLIATNSKNNLSNFEKLGVKILLCEEKNQKINLTDALQKLCKEGVNSALVEGGSNLTTQLLQENLIDEIVWIQSPKIIGNDGIPAIGDLGFSNLHEVIKNFSIKEIKELESDFALILKKP